jgi:hypothetical protein
MRAYLIGLKAKQCLKIRGMLHDYESPVELIQRPPAMKKYLYERRIEKLKRLEGEIAVLMEQGALKWFSRTYLR